MFLAPTACLKGELAGRGFGVDERHEPRVIDFRHPAGLAVRPDHMTMRDVDPLPLKFEDLRHTVQ